MGIDHAVGDKESFLSLHFDRWRKDMMECDV